MLKKLQINVANINILKHFLISSPRIQLLHHLIVAIKTVLNAREGLEAIADTSVGTVGNTFAIMAILGRE